MSKINKIKALIEQGEGIDIEFKESKNKLNKDVFESVCAFLNRNGGHLFIGIDDKSKIVGISNPQKILNEFITQANNPQKLNPPFYFLPEIITIQGKNIIYIYVPVSSQVHKLGERIYDRNSDGDFNITQNSELVTALYLRKQTGYSENMVFPHATLNDLRHDLINRVRKAIIMKFGEDYTFSKLGDTELLKSFGLILKDFKTGTTGLTLAAILLFGKDETILNLLPHHKTDAILRRYNIDRYDDRDDIRTNLLETYERLMNFANKHLPDPFYLENDVRISLRNKIFREAIVNILIHRDYINAYPAKMIIQKDQVLFENANKAHGYGQLLPETFSHYPKNPKIARIFKEIGLADELGSGVPNLFKYCKIYSKKNPELIEGDIFKINIALPIFQSEITEQVTEQVTEQAVINFCKTPKSTSEIMNFLNLKHREHFRASIL